MIPLPAATRRMRWLLASAIKRLPAASMATPIGEFSWALGAGPPSPLKPIAPVPATVVMIPVPAVTRRMRWWAVSAMKRFPVASTVAPIGKNSCAPVAWPPSPTLPPPATVMMIPVPPQARGTWLPMTRTRLSAASAFRRADRRWWLDSIGDTRVWNGRSCLEPRHSPKTRTLAQRFRYNPDAVMHCTGGVPGDFSVPCPGTLW